MKRPPTVIRHTWPSGPTCSGLRQFPVVGTRSRGQGSSTFGIIFILVGGYYRLYFCILSPNKNGLEMIKISKF